MKIKNRSASVVVYSIPDRHIRRRFIPGEIKNIPEDEIQELMYQPGGHYLLFNYLQASKEDVEKLNVAAPEREYFYSEEEIKTLVKTAPLDEFLDALDFAPEGTIDLFKHYAITLPMTDLQKIKALKDRTGFDAAKAQEHLSDTETSAAADTEISVSTRKRRVSDSEATANTGKYKVISEN